MLFLQAAGEKIVRNPDPIGADSYMRKFARGFRTPRHHGDLIASLLKEHRPCMYRAVPDRQQFLTRERCPIGKLIVADPRYTWLAAPGYEKHRPSVKEFLFFQQDIIRV